MCNKFLNSLPNYEYRVRYITEHGHVRKHNQDNLRVSIVSVLGPMSRHHTMQWLFVTLNILKKNVQPKLFFK